LDPLLHKDATTGEPANCLEYTVDGSIELKGSFDIFFLVRQTDTPEMVEAMLDVRAKSDAVSELQV
jgi:hypothetical protein